MKRHPTDLLSLLPGLLFVTIAVVALAGGLTVDLLSADWVWPVALIALGVLVLASAGLGRRGPVAPDEAVTDGAGADDAGSEPAADEVRGSDVR